MNIDSSKLNNLQKAYYVIRRQQEEIEKLKKGNLPQSIAVIGLACKFPGKVNNERDFWKLLLDEVDTIKEVPLDRWYHSKFYDEDVLAAGKTNSKWGGFVDDFSHFDPEFFNISRAELAEMDPQQRLLLQTSHEALENSGFFKPEKGNEIGGVFVGIGGMDHGFYLNSSNNPEEVGPYLGSGNAYSVASGRLSNWLGWTGPSVSYDTACSSSLISVHYACMHLAQRDCDVAIAGGVNVLLSEQVQISLSKAGMLSSDGRCKTFDEKANGYVRGEGCGMLVLKRLEDAIKDGDNIRAVISGSAIAQDGDSGVLTVPNRSSQESVIRKAIEKAGISPQDIQYVEAHGTGTSLGDPIEIDALSQVLSEISNKKEKVPVGSVKTNIGHLEAGAGIAGIIKVILSLENNLIPKHLNYDEPSSLIDWDQIGLEVCRTSRKWNNKKERYAGVSSFGFAGTIGHMILKEAPRTKEVSRDSQTQDLNLVISAKSKKGLNDFVLDYIKFLAETHVQWSDICYTAGFYRPRYDYQTIIKASSKEEAIYLLQKELQITKESESNIKLRLPLSGKKVVLPNYPFQNTAFLKQRKEDNWVNVLYKVNWVKDIEYKGKFEKTNYLLLSDYEKVESTHSLVQVMKNEGANTKLMLLDDFFQKKKIETFQRSPFSIVYLIDSDVSEYSSVLKIVWNTILTIQKLSRLSSETLQNIYVLGADDSIMQTVNGILKTSALEFLNMKPKCYTLNIDDETKVKLSLPYFNAEHAHRTMRFTKDSEFHQISPIKHLSKKEKLILSKDKVYLISGGMGSLGRELASFLIKRGAQRIWLLSRNDFTNENRKERIDWYNNVKGTVKELNSVQCDCSDENSMKELHQKIRKEKLIVGGVFHVAGMNRQQSFLDIKEEDCDFVMKAKVKGAILFDLYSRQWNPDYFVLFSSISATWGSSHLAHYAAANAFLNDLTNKRKHYGFSSLCIDWSAWEGSYMLNMNEEGINVLRESGVDFIKPSEALLILESLLISDENQVVVCKNNWEKFIPLMEMNGKDYFWNVLRKEEDENENISKGHFIIKGNTKLEKRDFLKHFLNKEMKLLLQYAEEEFIDESRPFSDLGMDSILAVRFVNRLNQLLNIDLSTNVVFNYPNITVITDYIFEILSEKGQNKVEEIKDKFEVTETVAGSSDDDWLSKIEKQLDKYDLE